jgi:hypothetical protein
MRTVNSQDGSIGVALKMVVQWVEVGWSGSSWDSCLFHVVLDGEAAGEQQADHDKAGDTKPYVPVWVRVCGGVLAGEA